MAAYGGGVTRAFIKDENISVEDIRIKLRQISEAIQLNNKMNLTDINIICEEIYGEILNELFDLELIAASVELSGQYAAVDLVDFDRGVAFQVTSRKDRNKIAETIEKFNGSAELRKIRSLNILILGDARSYQEPTAVTLKNGETFSFIENVFDNRKLEVLIEQKQKMDPKIVVKIYEVINMVLDSGRMRYTSIVKETKRLRNKEIICDQRDRVWKAGYGDIQLTAYIPLAYDEKISCMLEMRKSDLSGVYLTFGEEELIEDYFLGEESFVKRHNVGRYVDEDLMYMQIGHARFQVNAHTGYHIYQLFAELGREFENAWAEINEKLGAVGLKKVNDRYLIGTISLHQWEMMRYFARYHDWYREEVDLEWNIFVNTQACDRLILSPCAKSDCISGILAELVVKKSEKGTDMLDLFWQPGYRHDKKSMEGFDNVIKWRADYTRDWVNNKFLPKAQEFYSHENQKESLGIRGISRWCLSRFRQRAGMK